MPRVIGVQPLPSLPYPDRMAPLPRVGCNFPGCEFETKEDTPSYELALKALEVHQIAHRTTTEVKLKELPRPTADEDVSEGGWSNFEDRWARYKRSTLANDTPTPVADQL